MLSKICILFSRSLYICFILDNICDVHCKAGKPEILLEMKNNFVLVFSVSS